MAFQGFREDIAHRDGPLCRIGLSFCYCAFVITPERPILRLIQGDKDSLAIVVELDEEGLAARIDLCDIHLLVDESCFEQE